VCLKVAVCASGEWYCTAAILGEQLRVIVPERMQLWWQEGSDGYLCEFCALDSFVSPFFLVTDGCCLLIDFIILLRLQMP
jgi:hypothetical protein